MDRPKQTRVIKLQSLPTIARRDRGFDRVIDATTQPAPPRGAPPSAQVMPQISQKVQSTKDKLDAMNKLHPDLLPPSDTHSMLHPMQTLQQQQQQLQQKPPSQHGQTFNPYQQPHHQLQQPLLQQQPYSLPQTQRIPEYDPYAVPDSPMAGYEHMSNTVLPPMQSTDRPVAQSTSPRVSHARELLFARQIRCLENQVSHLTELVESLVIKIRNLQQQAAAVPSPSMAPPRAQSAREQSEEILLDVSLASHDYLRRNNLLELL